MPLVMGTPCGALFVSGCGVWPGVSICGGTCVPGAAGSPGSKISGSLPSGGLQRVQLFSGAASLTLESEEAISGENPVTISAEFDSGKTMAGFVIDPVDGSGNTIVDGTVSVETEKGKEKSLRSKTEK